MRRCVIVGVRQLDGHLDVLDVDAPASASAAIERRSVPSVGESAWSVSSHQLDQLCSLALVCAGWNSDHTSAMRTAL